MIVRLIVRIKAFETEKMRFDFQGVSLQNVSPEKKYNTDQNT